MNITLTGATGFIGAVLVEKLKAKGHELTMLGRRPGGAEKFLKWDSIADAFPAAAVEGADAIIHMAGEPVAQRWNDHVKRRIQDSRINGTRQLVHAIEAAAVKPKTLISASAIGFYGDRADEELDEFSKAGSGYLPKVCVEWENAAQAAAKLGVRVVLLRIGIVLHESGGALKTMLPFFRLGLGGPVGSGCQWMSWIHRDDLVGMLLWALEDQSVSGVINGVTPNPVRNVDFGRALGAVLSRPAVLPAPEFALRILYGEMASVVLGSQKVFPKVPVAQGYRFQFPELKTALQAAVS
jgi:uncharacterized protein (TIGR01777 family)